MELFLYGNPRYLAGGIGGSTSSRDDYESTPKVLTRRGVCTADLESTRPATAGSSVTVAERVADAGLKIHYGKSGYHSSVTRNCFLVDGQWPSAGVELETIASKCNGDHTARMIADLRSNWFHFERDGSLDSAHGGEYGFELITEPLPPRVYRDPRTWIGLENILAPWLESFDHSCTGLHVHVGLNQFRRFDAIPVRNPDSRMFIGKVMAMLVYYFVVDSAFIDRVCLRKQTSYCRTPSERIISEGGATVSSGKMTGYELIDMAVGKLLVQNLAEWAARADNAIGGITGSCHPAFCQLSLNGTTSHGTEVNTEHRYTVEFRRGKGTLHALSIHRMVELMTMIVRYAGKCCRCPEEHVSSKAFYDFVHDNTTSAPLKKLIEKTVRGGAAS